MWTYPRFRFPFSKYYFVGHACMLAYEANRTGAFANFLGHYEFEIVNLSSGEKLFSEFTDPGPNFKTTREKFLELRSQYIGSTTAAVL